MSKYLVISLLIVTLIIGIGLGYMLSPQYAMNAYESSAMTDLGKADKYVDLRYINAMIAHHKSAMELASAVKNSTQRKEIKDLAVEIMVNEPKAIDQLYQWKKEWYNDTTKIESSKIPNLGSYDENLDLRFLNALIAHHEDGVVMAKEIRLKSTRNEILNNANGVEDFLTNGIKMLSDWRLNWYKAN